MKIVAPRTLVELKVGDSQSVEVVIHVRRIDIPWFNGTVSREAIDTYIDGADAMTNARGRDDSPAMLTHLLDVIQKSILPRMFASEIEKNYYSSIGKSPPPELGPGGIPTVQATVPSTSGAPSKKAYSNKRQRISKAKLAEIKRLEQEAARQQRQDEKDVYYATNTENTLQVAYRIEAIPKYGHATLLFQPQCTNLVLFKKLQRRILLWCHPGNMDERTERMSFEIAGLYNPDMIPVSTFL